MYGRRIIIYLDARAAGNTMNNDYNLASHRNVRRLCI